MKQYKSSSDLKNMAREMLSGRYGSAMLVSPILNILIAFVILFSIYLVALMPLTVDYVVRQPGANDSSFFLAVGFVTVIAYCFIKVMNTGISLFYLNIACGKPYSASDILFGFRWHSGKSLAISTINVLSQFLFLLPYFIFSYLEIYYYDPRWSFWAPISYLIGIALYCPIQLALSQCYYLLLDFPQYRTIELVKMSIRVMKGHKRRLFYIHLSFIPLVLLNILSLGMGSLWILPYQNMTYTLFFLDLMKPNE